MYIYNARIHTLDPKRPVASALATRDGKIIAIGDDARILGEFCGLMPGEDMNGRTILPGLTDSHLHLENYALGLQKVDCETSTRAECLRRVAEHARNTPPGEWVLGHGWNQNNWPEGFGHAIGLDQVAPHHPVFLTAKSLHAAWANTIALKRADLNASTPEPANGRIGRDETGNPNGLLFESAMQLVEKVIPEPKAEQVADAIHAAQSVLWRMGLTGLHDFDRRRCFQALQILHERNALRLRVVKSLPLEDLPQAAAIGLRSGFGDDILRIGSVKIFTDGALGPQTAAMFQPFEGSVDNRGMLFLDAEELFEHGRLAVENGLSVAVHAIGDRANHEVLDAFTQLRRYETQHLPPSAGKLRHRIEHVQLILPQDAGRLAALGVTASMQPIHATSDMVMADRYWGERAVTSYAWKLQLDQGANLAFGSDAPVESPNPFWGLHAAVTRQRPDGSPSPEGWFPEQRLSLEQALIGFTRGAAYAAGWEQHLGILAPGFLADLIVLEEDLFKSPPNDLHRLAPCATMVGGEWVFKDI